MMRDPDLVPTFLRAWRLHQESDLEPALQLYEQVLARHPDDPDALHLSGVLLAQQGRSKEAIERIERALAVHPDNAAAHYNLGKAQRESNRREDAVASYDRALALVPSNVEAWSNRGTILLELGRAGDAVKSFDRALELDAAHVSSLHNRANALREMKRYDAAIAGYDRVLALEPYNVLALNGRGGVLQDLKRYDDALTHYERVSSLAPEFPFIDGWRLHMKMHICDWSGFESDVARLARRVSVGERVASPYVMLAADDSPERQLKAAEVYCRTNYPAGALPLWRGERYRHDKIRIGYVSGEFFEQATAYLMADLYECHDRERFELHAIASGTNDRSSMRKRLENAFDVFADVSAHSDPDVAELIRCSEIDILVNLNGYFGAARHKVFALRSAPVQVNYLGYPGTTGAPYMDYIIADETVIPADQARYYSENVVYLPDSYQPNDRKKRIGRCPTRASQGIPESGFVFCCFNNSFKFTPEVFDVWMRLLISVPGSVLWLYEGNASAKWNLRNEARRRGIEPERIVFASFKPLEEHLARVQLADLFLDTLPHNAHTTASDALWCGVPVLTCQGSSFAGRVASSLLKAVGLPELITSSLDEYEVLALQLARDPGKLAALKARLAKNRSTSALFDTPRYARCLEAAYVTMWERSCRGEQPGSFTVNQGALPGGGRRHLVGDTNFDSDDRHRGQVS